MATPGLEALAAYGERVLSDSDPWQALAGFPFSAIDAMLTDASISPVTADRAHAAGKVRRDVAQADLIPLMCGVVYAAKAHAGGHEPAPAAGRRYLAVTLDGLRALPSRGTASRCH